MFGCLFNKTICIKKKVKFTDITPYFCPGSIIAFRKKLSLNEEAFTYMENNNLNHDEGLITWNNVRIQS